MQFEVRSEYKVKKVNVEDREAGLGHAEGREGALGYMELRKTLNTNV